MSQFYSAIDLFFGFLPPVFLVCIKAFITVLLIVAALKLIAFLLDVVPFA